MDKIAPVQGYSRGIPWEMHLRAYDAYCARWGAQPALIDLEGRNCRGGFSVSELDQFIPGWRDELTERTSMLKSIEALDAALTLALEILGRQEPGDSRAVSEEFVGMAAIQAGDRSTELLDFVRKAKERIAALPPPAPPEITVTTDAEWRCPKCGVAADERYDCCEVYAEQASLPPQPPEITVTVDPWTRLGDRLPEVAQPILLATKADYEDFWRGRDAVLLIRHEGVCPDIFDFDTHDGSAPRNWWFDAIYSSKNGSDLRIPRPDYLWMPMPIPGNVTS